MTAVLVRPTAVKLAATMRERLAHLAGQRQRSAHWMMREAIAQYVEREEKRAQYRDDGKRAWADYEATGLHAGQAVADTWLAQLEAGIDVEPPPCHR